MDEALALLAEHGDDARVLAGGQSLVPMLNLRVARPAVLVDINPVEELAGICVDDGGLHIGALTRHAAVERSPLVAAHAPLLAQAMRYVAHPAIRNRGTFGGSCALADPAAELPACCVALEAEFHVARPGGRVTVPAADFFRGLYDTALGPGDLLLGARIPLRPAERCGFGELARRHGDYAMVGLAVQGRIEGGVARGLRPVYFAVGDRPVRATSFAAALEGRPLRADAIDAALPALDAELDPAGDLHASAALKRQLARVLARRVLLEMGDGG